MLSEWFKQVDNVPNWGDLADAIETIDPTKAKTLKDKQVS